MRVAVVIVLSLVAIVLSPLVGEEPIDLAAAFANIGDWDHQDVSILFVVRVPRVLLGALAGAALAMAGVVFQALLRNPLATPYTLGVSSGGALGAVLAIKLGLDVTFLGFSSVSLFALLGAGGTIALVYFLARSRNQLPTSVLLLAGVAVSFFYAALILFLHYVADLTESNQMLRWMMGGLDVMGYEQIWAMLPLWLFGVGWLVIRSRDLDQLAFGGLLAHSRGVDVVRSQRALYLASSLVVGAVVSVAGPIGFVGLIVPHSMRFIVGPSNGRLLLASAFAGAGFLVICDIPARTLMAPTQLPIGILTALLGGPFFMGLLLRQKKSLSYED